MNYQRLACLYLILKLCYLVLFLENIELNDQLNFCKFQSKLCNGMKLMYANVVSDTFPKIKFKIFNQFNFIINLILLLTDIFSLGSLKA